MKKVFVGLLFIIFTITLSAQVPEWQWATQAGGSGGDHSAGIVLDEYGNSYITGYFAGTATFGSYSITSNGNNDIYVAKMDANGNWQWVTQAGGSISDFFWEYGRGITIDNNENTYITGFFRGTAIFGSDSLTCSGDRDIFVAKMDPNGNWLWATKAGGDCPNQGSEITIDNTGNTYITGGFGLTVI